MEILVRALVIWHHTQLADLLETRHSKYTFSASGLSASTRRFINYSDDLRLSLESSSVSGDILALVHPNTLWVMKYFNDLMQLSSTKISRESSREAKHRSHLIVFMHTKHGTVLCMISRNFE